MFAQAVQHPLQFQWHPEVWLLVAFLTAAYIYMVRVIGPNAVPAGTPVVTRKQIGWRVVLYLLLLTGLTYAVKRKVWADVH